MTQYNRLNTKLSNSQLNKLKSAIKNEIDVVIRLCTIMISKIMISMLLGTSGASLLGNLLTGKGVNNKGKGIHRAGEEIVRAAEGNKMEF